MDNCWEHKEQMDGAQFCRYVVHRRDLMMSGQVVRTGQSLNRPQQKSEVVGSAIGPTQQTPFHSGKRTRVNMPRLLLADRSETAFLSFVIKLISASICPIASFYLKNIPVFFRT